MAVRSAALGVLALTGTAILWGSNHVVARGSTAIVPLTAFIFWRWTLAVPLMLIVAWPALRRHRAVIRENLSDLALLGSVGVGIFSALLIAGAYYSRAVEVSMINATTPAWVALFGLLRREQSLTGRQWGGLALALTGTILILTRGDLTSLAGMESRLGNLLALSAAILFAWFSTRLRRYSGHLPAFALTTVTATLGTAIVTLPMFLVAVLFFGSGVLANTPDGSTRAAAIVLYSALGPTLLGNAFYIYGLSVIGPQRAASFLYLAPVVSSVLAVIYLSEPIRAFHFVGYAMILTGLFMINLGPSDAKGSRPS